MKYIVEASINDTTTEIELSCRSDARLHTLARKALSEMHTALYQKGLVGCRATITVELPNIWTNGGLGFLALDNIAISVKRADGGYIFL